MYVLLHKDTMAILYRCEQIETLRALANIEFVDSRLALFEETNRRAYDYLHHSQIDQLFSSLAGSSEPANYPQAKKVDMIMRLCQTLPPSAVEGFEAVVQSLRIKPTDKSCYQYVAGECRPRKLKEPPERVALVGNWEAAQALPSPRTIQSPPQPAQMPANPVPWAIAPTATPPKYAPPWA